MEYKIEMLLKHSFIEKNYSSKIFKKARRMTSKVKKYKDHFSNSGVKYEHKYKISACSETTLIFENLTFLFHMQGDQKKRAS